MLLRRPSADISNNRRAPLADIVLNARSLTAQVGGVQRYTAELCNRLNDIVPVSPRHPLHGAKGHLWEQASLPLRTEGRLLFSPGNSGPLAIERQIVTIHDIAVLDHPEWFNRHFARWYSWLLPRLLKRVRRIIAVSEFTKRRIVNAIGIDPEKIAVIPNGIDERFRSTPKVHSRKDCQNTIVPCESYILSVGSLEPRKNLNRLLQAWSRCLAELPSSVWLVITGLKGSRRVFQDASSLPDIPRVYFTGYLPDSDLGILYQGATALIYPSVYEGFGLPVLEAMACGVPSIAGNNTSLPEVMAEAGLSVDPYDVDQIAAAIVRVVRDRCFREELKRRSLVRSRLFDWDRTAKATWDLLLETSRQ
jgi:glycosyltransferase involved in cell wall biosynthesis